MLSAPFHLSVPATIPWGWPYYYYPLDFVDEETAQLGICPPRMLLIQEGSYS